MTSCIDVYPRDEERILFLPWFLASFKTEHFKKLKTWNLYFPGDSKWPFYPLVGGHLTSKRVTFSPSQKGHQQNCQVCVLEENFGAKFFFGRSIDFIWLGSSTHLFNPKRACCGTWNMWVVSSSKLTKVRLAKKWYEPYLIEKYPDSEAFWGESLGLAKKKPKTTREEHP